MRDEFLEVILKYIKEGKFEVYKNSDKITVIYPNEYICEQIGLISHKEIERIKYRKTLEYLLSLPDEEYNELVKILIDEDAV